MFTGIIDHCGVIQEILPITEGLQFWIQHQFGTLDLGESIAVDGVCLTVTQTKDNRFCCDISPETLKLTTFHTYQLGQQVNLERSLQPTSRMGGHIVMAHVDQTALIKSIVPKADFIEITFSGFDAAAQKFLVKKGSIAIHGVSLTINELTSDGFKIMLIPHTLDRTNLSQLRENDTVNIEFDLMARMVAKQLENVMR